MVRFTQLGLGCLLFFVCIVFYKNYFVEDKYYIDIIKNDTKTLDKINQLPKNNSIQNLTYKVDIDKNRSYEINSEYSELFYEKNTEILNMRIVNAKYSDQQKSPIFIFSDQAIYNSSNYITKFSNNVKITYLEHIIKAENAIIDFKKNFILINKDVEYDSPLVTMKTDNIEINLITSSIKIFMNNQIEYVKLESKE